MIELESPQIEPVEELAAYAKYEASPLPAGYGVTIGNALRRVLLSSLEGAAVTSIQVRDVYHEFSTIPGVKEDVTAIGLDGRSDRFDRLLDLLQHQCSLAVGGRGSKPGRVLNPAAGPAVPARKLGRWSSRTRAAGTRS